MWTQSGRPQKENTEHGLKIRKIYLQKGATDNVRVSGAYYPVMSNIDSRTTSTPVNITRIRILLPSNIVLEESMMQVSFGLVTATIRNYK